MFKALSISTVKHPEIINYYNSDFKVSNMFTGQKDQAKIEEPIPTLKIHIIQLLILPFLQKELFQVVTILFLSDLFCLHNFQAVCSSPNIAISVIH
jgi:hypothetical protein